MRYLLLLCLGLVAAGCNRGPEGARATARSFLEAVERGDGDAVRRLVTVPKGTPEDVVDLAIDSRIATARAIRRVAEAAEKRFGAGVSESVPLFRTIIDDLRALDAAAVEMSGKTATLPLGRRKPLTLVRGFWSWKVKLLDEIPTAAQRERMSVAADAAAAAADFTVDELEADACGDAECAASMFQSQLFVLRSRAATQGPDTVERGPAVPMESKDAPHPANIAPSGR